MMPSSEEVLCRRCASLPPSYVVLEIVYESFLQVREVRIAQDSNVLRPIVVGTLSLVLEQYPVHRNGFTQSWRVLEGAP